MLAADLVRTAIPALAGPGAEARTYSLGVLALVAAAVGSLPLMCCRGADGKPPLNEALLPAQGSSHSINAGWVEAPQDGGPLPGGVRHGAPRTGAPLPGGSNADGERRGAAAPGGPACPYAEVPFYTAVRLGSP